MYIRTCKICCISQPFTSLPPFTHFSSQIHSCRDSLRLPSRPVLEQAERKLVEWGKSDEALEKVAEMLGKVVHRTVTVVPEEKIPPPPSALLPHHAKDLTAQSSPVTPSALSAGLSATHNNIERLNLIEVRGKVNSRRLLYDVCVLRGVCVCNKPVYGWMGIVTLKPSVRLWCCVAIITG